MTKPDGYDPSIQRIADGLGLPVQVMMSQPQVLPKLRVQIGDVIRRGRGDYSQTMMIVWTNRSYVPGATDATATEREAPSERAHPADAICLVPPRGDGQFMGTAADVGFMRYLGFLEFSEEEMDQADEDGDDYRAREGHTWEIQLPGFHHVADPWWETFRAR